jgi:hypothetical protein
LTRGRRSLRWLTPRRSSREYTAIAVVTFVVVI